MQVRLHRPADLEAGVALRAEEDGFWGRPVSASLQGLLQTAGYPQARALRNSAPLPRGRG